MSNRFTNTPFLFQFAPVQCYTNNMTKMNEQSVLYKKVCYEEKMCVWLYIFWKKVNLVSTECKPHYSRRFEIEF